MPFLLNCASVLYNNCCLDMHNTESYSKKCWQVRPVNKKQSLRPDEFLYTNFRFYGGKCLLTILENFSERASLLQKLQLVIPIWNFAEIVTFNFQEQITIFH